MGAPLNEFRRDVRKRGIAVVASGAVISLTALTAGLAPAVAQPDSDDVVTTVAPEPRVSAPEPEVTVEQPTSAPEPQVPATQVAPQTQAPQTQAPQTQAPVVEPEPAAEPEPAPAPQPEPAPQTVAPPKTSTAVQSAEPSTPAAEPSAPAERTPATSAAPRTSAAAPATKPETSEPAEPGESTASSAAIAPASETETPTSSDKTVAETTGNEESGSDSDTPTVSIENASKEIETLAPETLEAPAEDVELARNAKPVFEPEPAPAPEEDVTAFKQSVDMTLGLNGAEASASAKVELEAKRDRDFELVSNVRQWQPEWIEYDEFYRPVLMNPFRAPVRIVYVYDMRPRIAYIPPLSRLVLEAAQFAAYSFTAALLSPVVAAANVAQAVSNIAVGTFFGGGYFPGAGLPLPPPPPPVLRYDNVPVLVNYSNARYEPFRVRQIVDVGEDRVYGGRKVLLDGATPVWGEWTQTASGERQFEVRKTQQFPGLSEPAEAPLPGDYRLRLASDQASTGGLTGRDIFLMVSAGVIGTLGFGAIGLAFFLGRRRPEH
ncbi:hypothetical protein A5790_05960 [Mycobacterium sp. 852002-51152_SCH6134967]|uniref:hypothetical protein n=1 Tax=Mycobacterium sp. 852002-51152_SCH6134967 TaxID=1834096 RepID=UPI000801939F|nr:hypothetical protein [Mycobacterium sp. 852002-51152_SCH6134967]OBF96228.1 hypothetical protein A5790_05960 [Mycobacterium sp. 852002-51152_SCH6134967]